MVMELMASRRIFLAGVLVAMAEPALAAPSSRLAFQAFRKGERIGEHKLTFQRAGDDLTVLTEAEMRIALGPVTLLRYRHTATERWSAGRFASLSTRTSSNGRLQQVTAEAAADGVTVQGPAGLRRAPPGTLPLTHWNSACMNAALFNPQDGKLLRVNTVRRGPETVITASGAALSAVRYSLTGDAEIDDWYDADGQWAALRGRLKDGSILEYRRL